MLIGYRSMTMYRSFADHMGFNWPKDLAMIVNGERITFSQLKEERIARQKSHLREISTNHDSAIYPCFICTFYNKGFPFGGWWLCVYTLKNSWTIDFRDYREDLILKIMQMYPLGYLPLIEGFEQWKATFANTYHYPTQKRPRKNGATIAKARISPVGQLLDILPLRLCGEGDN